MSPLRRREHKTSPWWLTPDPLDLSELCRACGLPVSLHAARRCDHCDLILCSICTPSAHAGTLLCSVCEAEVRERER